MRGTVPSTHCALHAQLPARTAPRAAAARAARGPDWDSPLAGAPCFVVFLLLPLGRVTTTNESCMESWAMCDVRDLMRRLTQVTFRTCNDVLFVLFVCVSALRLVMFGCKPMVRQVYDLTRSWPRGQTRTRPGGLARGPPALGPPPLPRLTGRGRSGSRALLAGDREQEGSRAAKQSCAISASPPTLLACAASRLACAWRAPSAPSFFLAPTHHPLVA